MAALGIPKHESDREGETGLPQIQRARWSFPLPSKSHPIQETMLARDMVVIFSLIFCHIWEKLSLHSHNQKDRGEATFLKTYLWDGSCYQHRLTLLQEVPWAHGGSPDCAVCGTCNANWCRCVIWNSQDCLCSGSGRSGMCPHLSYWLEAALGTFVLLVSVWTPNSLHQSSLTSLACNPISIREEKSSCSY